MEVVTVLVLFGAMVFVALIRRRVASSLAAALDAERSLRLGSPKQDEAHRARSAERIAERSYELDAAAEDLQWLIEAED